MGKGNGNGNAAAQAARTEPSLRIIPGWFVAAAWLWAALVLGEVGRRIGAMGAWPVSAPGPLVRVVVLALVAGFAWQMRRRELWIEYACAMALGGVTVAVIGGDALLRGVAAWAG